VRRRVHIGKPGRHAFRVLDLNLLEAFARPAREILVGKQRLDRRVKAKRPGRLPRRGRRTCPDAVGTTQRSGQRGGACEGLRLRRLVLRKAALAGSLRRPARDHRQAGKHEKLRGPVKIQPHEAVPAITIR
jgi:hypothetical protein